MGACPCSLMTPLPSPTMTKVPWRITTWQQPSGSCRSPSIASWRQVPAMHGAACLWLHLDGQHLQPSKAALYRLDRQLTHVAKPQQPRCLADRHSSVSLQIANKALGDSLASRCLPISWRLPGLAYKRATGWHLVTSVCRARSHNLASSLSQLIMQAPTQQTGNILSDDKAEA